MFWELGIVVVAVVVVVARQLVAKVANFDDGSKLFKIKRLAYFSRLK